MFRWLVRLKSSLADVWSSVAALRHPRTPLLAKFLFVLAIAYAVDPFDLIPDAIPGIGVLDDLIIVPLLFSLAWRLIPPGLAQELRARPRPGMRTLRRTGFVLLAAFALISVTSLVFVGSALYMLLHII